MWRSRLLVLIASASACAAQADAERIAPADPAEAAAQEGAAQAVATPPAAGQAAAPAAAPPAARVPEPAAARSFLSALRENTEGELFVAGGAIAEYAHRLNAYRGLGAQLAYRWSANWGVHAGYRVDRYRMQYYGLSWQTANALFGGAPTGISAAGNVLTKVGVTERRDSAALALTWTLAPDAAAWKFGVGRQRLENSFSAMTLYGPWVGARITQDWAGYRFAASASALIDRWGKMGAQDPLFAVFDGERSASYFGEARWFAGWRVAIAPLGGGWGRLRLAYEGGVTGFKYTARHEQGIALGIAF
ncbi:MAG: hypothetical protein OEW21_07455 [Betaproteobacteria bacterium]|nr:hypothetical protein [Betaproteobacteria bacterium]